MNVEDEIKKMLRHISNTKLQFSTFFKEKFKKFQDGRLYLLQEKTTIQRRQAFQQHAAFLSSLSYQERFNENFPDATFTNWTEQ